jgi:hypothetical protein
MIAQMRGFAYKAVNSVLALGGLKLVRQKAYFADYQVYIPCRETIAEAKKAGMSVGEYIDAIYGSPGSTKETIDQMATLGALPDTIERVCEIGPGSGRYLEKIIQLCQPSHYEIYETAADWAIWLSNQYDVSLQPTDGMSLASTPSNSIDLVHMHKVLPGQSLLTIWRYYSEMARVVRYGGKVVFDIVTEECMTDEIVEGWLKVGSGYQHYPCLVPKQYTIDFFCKRGFSHDGDFFIPMKPGLTHYLVFTKFDKDVD